MWRPRQCTSEWPLQPANVITSVDLRRAERAATAAAGYAAADGDSGGAAMMYECPVNTCACTQTNAVPDVFVPLIKLVSDDA